MSRIFLAPIKNPTWKDFVIPCRWCIGCYRFSYLHCQSIHSQSCRHRSHCYIASADSICGHTGGASQHEQEKTQTKQIEKMTRNPSVKRDWLTAGFARFQPAPYLQR